MNYELHAFKLRLTNFKRMAIVSRDLRTLLDNLTLRGFHARRPLQQFIWWPSEIFVRLHENYRFISDRTRARSDIWRVLSDQHMMAISRPRLSRFS
jgi:hypothetical protein